MFAVSPARCGGLGLCVERGGVSRRCLLASAFLSLPPPQTQEDPCACYTAIAHERAWLLWRSVLVIGMFGWVVRGTTTQPPHPTLTGAPSQ